MKHSHDKCMAVLSREAERQSRVREGPVDVTDGNTLPKRQECDLAWAESGRGIGWKR